MSTPTETTAEFKPFVSPNESPKELTWPALVAGTLLGILFGASSLYLVLKVGLTVSASVPVAVLSITLFRVFSRTFKVRQATILENNVVQTAGSAGESIAFGVGVTMPALLLLGFDMDPVRVMTVSILGGLLGILMMIPLRRAFIVKQHGKLTYPEGVACAEVLKSGERGGATAKMVFIGFGIASAFKFLSQGMKLWATEPAHPLTFKNDDGTTSGLKGAQIEGELAPELLGVGYLVGPRVACLMMAGAILSYFIIAPMIATFGASAEDVIAPAKQTVKGNMGIPAVVGAAFTSMENDFEPGLIRNMSPGKLKGNYVKYIGAGAVAAGGIISMCKALPLIFASVVGGLRDLRASRGGAGGGNRTEKDLPITVVIWGSLALVLTMALVPQLGLGFNFEGLLAAGMILVFGFLFVTVSSRLTGEVGSSSNPISGMTIATLLLVCLIFLILGKTDTKSMLLALSVASVVCIASSNGGTTSQDLKTGYLVGATPWKQQIAILVGTLISAAVIGLTMLALDSAGTHYVKRDIPDRTITIPATAPTTKVGHPYTDTDKNDYRLVYVRDGEYPEQDGKPNVNPAWYLVAPTTGTEGKPVYIKDTPINQQYNKLDNGNDAPKAFTAPQPRLFSNIIEGILGGKLQWGLIAFGVMLAVVLEMIGVSALPVAVGMYLSLSSTVPIFIGGMLRLITDKMRGKPESDADAETSPGVLLASGYIAGGTLCGLVLAFFAFLPDSFNEALAVGSKLFSKDWADGETGGSKLTAVIMFGLIATILVWIGRKKD